MKQRGTLCWTRQNKMKVGRVLLFCHSEPARRSGRHAQTQLRTFREARVFVLKALVLTKALLILL